MIQIGLPLRVTTGECTRVAGKRALQRLRVQETVYGSCSGKKAVKLKNLHDLTRNICKNREMIDLTG
jgi:hypothetical protein